MSEKKLRYSDQELAEFRVIIKAKIEEAKKDLANLEDSNNPIRQERSIFEMTLLIKRQMKYVQNLRIADSNIDNKTYGICRATGVLISKERLQAVPHATLSISAKQ